MSEAHAGSGRLLRALGEMRQEMQHVSLDVAYSFLLTAAHEGAALRELAYLAGLPLTTMSRHLLDLGDYTRRHEPGLGLIASRRNPLELRRNEYTLTAKGKALLYRIERAIDGRLPG